MIRRLLPAALLLLALATASFADTWEVDPGHSSLGFTVKHMVISKVNGHFSDFDGNVTFDGKDLASGSCEFTAQAKSITTDNERRDNHLRSPDFFAVDSFPTLTFKSKKVIAGENNTFKLVGDLTIRGVTKEVTFDGTFNGTVSAFGGMRASFSATTTINRMDYGVSWSKTLDSGGLVASNEVVINVELEVVKAKS